jgi:uncharacterized protein YdhG (YjbR/CyaY superfamily)
MVTPSELGKEATPMNDTKKPAKRTTAADKSAKVFTDDERDAIKNRAAEVKAAGRKGAPADEEATLLAKVDEMAASDRAMARRLHAIVKASAPSLSSTTWYGMPAYARDGKIVCFFQPAKKFKTRYSTLGFNDAARLDDGQIWPVAYALGELTAADEAQIGALVKKAAG